MNVSIVIDIYAYVDFVHIYNIAASDLSQPEDELPEEEWINNEDESNRFMQDIGEDSEPEDVASVQDLPPQSLAIVRWLTLFLLSLQAAYRLSNRAVNYLFRFLATLFSVLARYTSEFNLAQSFPSTLYLAKKRFLNKVKFLRYIVCRKCFNVYKISDCIEGPVRSPRSKVCPFQPYANHPHRSRRGSCQTLLMKSVELIGGRRILYPFLVYCYLGVEATLQQVIQRPNIEKWCEEWRYTQRNDDTYCDVYDGKVWQDFMNYNGSPYLSEPNNLALLLNMDFFQPYKHLKGYSVGGIYCVIMNLPRAIRYKQENVLLIGLIPGPKEPDHDINSFLDPMVKELNQFWSGKRLSCNEGAKVFKCALLCIACDIPAGRKVCGFLGHNAHYACSRCFKRFPGTFGTINFSGFDRESWPKRDGRLHRRIAMGLRSFTTQAEQDRMESQAGLRYSSLLQLPYFDAPRMLIVDPMHNLFLGSAKRVMQCIWIERNILTDRQFKAIQERVDHISVPPGIGRIPIKIQSGFSAFSADQWKNWTLYFSTMVLFDVLNTADLECWRHFVLGCRLLCHRTLTKMQLQLGDSLIMQFCRKVEQLYGKDEITANMHLHAHLRSCIEDYGPLYGFWVYAFERYNGILESVSNNGRCIEPQLIERFLNDSMVHSTQLPTEFEENFSPFFSSMQRDHSVVGSLADTMSCTPPSEESSFLQSCEYDETLMVLPSCRSKLVLDSTQQQELQKLYANFYSTASLNDIDVPSTCWKYASVTFHGKVLGCHNSRSNSSSIVAAMWRNDLFGFPLSSIVEDLVPANQLIRPARINSFLLHRPIISGEQRTILLVHLSWYKFHPKMLKLGKPNTVWCSSVFELDGIHSVVPIHLIQSRTVTLVTDLDGESVLIMCQCINF